MGYAPPRADAGWKARRGRGHAPGQQRLRRGGRLPRSLPAALLDRSGAGGRAGRWHLRARPPGARVDRRPPPGGGDRPLARRAARVRPALALPRAGRLRALPPLHARLRVLGGARPGGGAGAHPGPRHPPEHPRPRLHARGGPRACRALPPQQRGAGAGLGDHDLHRPGLEHDLQLLLLAPLRPARPDRGRHPEPVRLVAALPLGGAPLQRHRARLEQHDEHGRGLVLPDGERGLRAGGQGLPPPRPRLLHERRGGPGRRAGHARP